MKILLAGSGTAGPVVPLLAVAKRIKSEHQHAKFLFVGTKHGPEAQLAAAAGLEFASIAAGKWRRYFSPRNLAAPFEVIAGFFQALRLIGKFDPDVVFGASGYVCVPVCLAAFIRRRKIVIHQQDVLPSLTNKILAPLADKITVTFEHSLRDFSSGSGVGNYQDHKVVWTGNPFRPELLEHFSKERQDKIRQKIGATEQIPVLLIFGGGTGATAINFLLAEALPELCRYFYVVHLTGKGKRQNNFAYPRYLPAEFSNEMPELYAIADLVICRAGLSTLTELSVLKKLAVVIPIPDSHQIDNALILKYADAAVVLNQDYLTAPELIAISRKILYDLELQRTLRHNIGRLMPHNATERVAKLLIELCLKAEPQHRKKP